MPAFVKGMDENIKEIDAITNNPEDATFSNTIEELERTGKSFQKFNVLFQICKLKYQYKTSRTKRELSPLLSVHYDKIVLNEKLLKESKLWKRAKETLTKNKKNY